MILDSICAEGLCDSSRVSCKCLRKPKLLYSSFARDNHRPGTTVGADFHLRVYTASRCRFAKEREKRLPKYRRAEVPFIRKPLDWELTRIAVSGPSISGERDGERERERKTVRNKTETGSCDVGVSISTETRQIIRLSGPETRTSFFLLFSPPPVKTLCLSRRTALSSSRVARGSCVRASRA